MPKQKDRNRRKMLRDNIQGLTAHQIAHLCASAGLAKIDESIIHSCRDVMGKTLQGLVRDAVTFMEHARRTNISAHDVLQAVAVRDLSQVTAQCVASGESLPYFALRPFVKVPVVARSAERLNLMTDVGSAAAPAGAAAVQSFAHVGLVTRLSVEGDGNEALLRRAGSDEYTQQQEAAALRFKDAKSVEDTRSIMLELQAAHTNRSRAGYLATLQTQILSHEEAVSAGGGAGWEAASLQVLADEHSRVSLAGSDVHPAGAGTEGSTRAQGERAPLDPLVMLAECVPGAASLLAQTYALAGAPFDWLADGGYTLTPCLGVVLRQVHPGATFSAAAHSAVSDYVRIMVLGVVSIAVRLTLQGPNMAGYSGAYGDYESRSNPGRGNDAPWVEINSRRYLPPTILASRVPSPFLPCTPPCAPGPLASKRQCVCGWEESWRSTPFRREPKQ